MEIFSLANYLFAALNFAGTIVFAYSWRAQTAICISSGILHLIYVFPFNFTCLDNAKKLYLCIIENDVSHYRSFVGYWGNMELLMGSILLPISLGSYVTLQRHIPMMKLFGYPSVKLNTFFTLFFFFNSFHFSVGMIVRA